MSVAGPITRPHHPRKRLASVHPFTYALTLAVLFAVVNCTTTTTTYSRPSSTAVPAADAIRLEVLAMMDSSARAWNHGDLDGFIAFYDPTLATTFVTPESILRGPIAIRAVYAPRFSPGGIRDSLSFENMEVDVLSPDVVNVIAYYRLMRGDSTTARGPTSLVMRRRGGGWRIVHDHSS